MEIICDCQLSKNLKDYVWAYNRTEEMNDDNEDMIIINISPKLTFHWDCHLYFLNLPKELRECCEGVFEIDKNIDVKNLMNNLNIEYNQDLDNLINSDIRIKCKCQECNRITIKYELKFINKNIRCSSNYKHLKVIISNIKYSFNNYKDINLIYSNPLKRKKE